jgi:hypothetical protein
MKDDIHINREDPYVKDVKGSKMKKRSVWGIGIGIGLILLGMIWYAYLVGLIPLIYLQYWPQILIVLVGILILIKSL